MSGFEPSPPLRGRGQGEGGAGAGLGQRRDDTPALLPPSPQGGGGDIVAIARSWLHTPYRHQSSVKGVGCDCLGLVRGVWRELYGKEPQALPAYRPDWAEVGGRETLLEGARRHLVEVPLNALQPGDVLLFRMAADCPAKHCAILTALPTAHDPQPRMIHAYWGRAVVESWIGPWWARRLAFAFAYPLLPRAAGEGDREAVEGAAQPSKDLFADVAARTPSLS